MKLCLFFACLCAVSLQNQLFCQETQENASSECVAVAEVNPDAKESNPRVPRVEDLKCILEKMFLAENSAPLLNMMAGEALNESEKTMDSQELIQKFRQSFEEEKTLSRFCSPYDSVFSDQEIHQLREIHELPVYEKFSKQGVKIFQQNFLTLKETFRELVELNGQEIAANTHVVEITSSNYKDEIKESNKPVILDVYATWCGACRSMEPTFRELSAEYKDTVRFAKINYDTEQEIVKKYNVTLLPTFIFIRPGENKAAMMITGGMSKAEFEAEITQFLGENPKKK